MIDPKLQPVADAIRAGNTFEAIELLRNATGMSLAEAKDAVARLSADVSVTDTGVPVQEVDFTTALDNDLAALRAPRDPDTTRLQGALADEVAALALVGKLYDAVTLVRTRSGVDLKTAKDQVELLMEDRGIAKKSSKGCLVAVIAIIFLVAIVFIVLEI